MGAIGTGGIMLLDENLIEELRMDEKTVKEIMSTCSIFTMFEYTNF